MVVYLEPHEDSAMSGAKFIWNCGKITEENKTTNGWLEDVTALKIIPISKALSMSGKKILEGILQKKKLVVVLIYYYRS